MVLAIVLRSTVIAQEKQARRMAITTTSEEARALYLQARQYQEMSQPESARPLLEQALELDPTFAMALDALRSVAPTFKASREVLARLQEVLETASLSEGERLHFEALQAALAGDREHQREILESMVEQFPDDERIRYRLALFHYGNDNQRAAEILTEVTRLNPAFVPAYNTLGYSLRSLGREEDAEHAFQTAIELNPDNPNAYDSYAELLLSQGRHEASIAYYEETLAREPLFPSAQIGVAANLILLNRHAEARRRLDTLFQIAPHDGIRSGVHWAKAVTYVDEGHMDQALAELEKNLALSQKADDRAAMALDLTNIATCLIEQGTIEKAHQKIALALEHRLAIPGVPDIQKSFARFNHLYMTGRAHVADGALTEAEVALGQLRTLAEQLDTRFAHQRVHELKGILALAQGDYPAAIEEIEQADADEVYNLYRLAQAYEGLGNTRRAADYYAWVVGYNSPLNLHYSFVRHKAKARLDALRG